MNMCITLQVTTCFMRQIRVRDFYFFLMNEFDKIKQDQSCIQRHRSSNKCLKCKYVQQFALEKPLFFCILPETVVL